MAAAGVHSSDGFKTAKLSRYYMCRHCYRFVVMVTLCCHGNTALSWWRHASFVEKNTRPRNCNTYYAACLKRTVRNKETLVTIATCRTVGINPIVKVLLLWNYGAASVAMAIIFKSSWRVNYNICEFVSLVWVIYEIFRIFFVYICWSHKVDNI